MKIELIDIGSGGLSNEGTVTILNCQRLQFPRFLHEQGSICTIESGLNVPFDIKRIFYLYDVAAGESRGAHAHFHCHQVLVCISGSFSVKLDDGREQATVLLDRPWFGLHIPPMIWAEEVDFDPGTVCLVLTSEVYEEADYIRNYDDYLQLIRERGGGWRIDQTSGGEGLRGR